MNYFQCNQCQSRFKKKERLEQHMLKKHSDFECETCGKKFPEQGSLKEHVRVCLSFKRSQNVHIFCFQVHTGERPHQCTECGATFSFQSNLISHRFEVLNTKTSQKVFSRKMHFREQGLTEEEAKLRLYYFCDTCGKNYANKVKSPKAFLISQKTRQECKIS